MGIVLLFVFGIALIAAPVTASALGHPLGTLATAVMLVFGSGLTLLAGILGTITKLYQKTKANEALVRTGMGGMKVITDGGALIIPDVHTLVRVSLATQKLVVARKAKEALLTEDKLRADVTAEFYVRVQPLDDSIKNAARSFGDQMGDSKTVTALVADKLVSALRTVAATMTLEDLNKARDQFVRQVTEIVKPDLEHNGLTLEGVTISELDQTDLTSLSENNIFDAQGRAAVARIVQAKKTEVNQLQKEGDQARAKQDLETAKRLLEFAQDQATATAQQAAEVAKVTAEQDRIAKEAEIATTKAVELANIEQAKQTEVATRAKQQAVETAEREKQAAIADAQAKQAEAEAKLATAEALRETERQAVKTVQVEADANRAKTTQVINAEATAQTAYVQAQKAADAQAYTMKAKADGQKAAADAEAEATIKKASADAEATTKRANAEAAAAEARARGEQAVAMVPVSVASAQVDVEQRKVAVLQQELEARAANGAAMQEFELAQLRITKEAEIRIAGAQAMAALSGTIHANVFGTPETVARMTETYMKGMGVSTAVEGFFAGAGNDTKELAEGAGSTIAGLLRSVVARLESGDSGQAKAPVAVTATQATPAKTTGVQNNGG